MNTFMYLQTEKPDHHGFMILSSKNVLLTTRSNKECGNYINDVPAFHRTMYAYIGVFGERKLLYKFGTVQAMK